MFKQNLKKNSLAIKRKQCLQNLKMYPSCDQWVALLRPFSVMVTIHWCVSVWGDSAVVPGDTQIFSQLSQWFV